MVVDIAFVAVVVAVLMDYILLHVGIAFVAAVLLIVVVAVVVVAAAAGEHAATFTNFIIIIKNSIDVGYFKNRRLKYIRRRLF
jgi:hypothetical protein